MTGKNQRTYQQKLQFNMKPYSIIFALCFLTNLAWGQNGKAVFESTSHDFGEIPEQDGPVTHVFQYKNTGYDPIILTYVKASCGCTSPSWTTEPVAKGDSGFVKVVFNPRGRAGTFLKTVTVRTNGEPQALVLRIKGVVKPKPKGIEDIYKYDIGNLSFNTRYLSFQDVLEKSSKSMTFSVYNPTGKTIKIDWQNSRIPDYIHIKNQPLQIDPKDSTEVEVVFDATKQDDWGFVFGAIYMKTDDAEEPDKRIGFSARIKEDFGKLPEGAPSPKVVYVKERHDFGEVEQGKSVSTRFELKNEGDSDLIIRKTKTSCGCTASTPEKDVIKPGESTFIDVVFSSGGRQGKQKKSITVITNDPKMDEKILWIEASVEKKSSDDGK